MPVDYTEPRVHNDSPDHWGPILAAVARDVLGDPSTATRHQWRYGTHGSLVVHISGPRASTWIPRRPAIFCCNSRPFSPRRDCS